MNSFHFRANTLESRFLEPSIFLHKPNQRLTIPNASLTSTLIIEMAWAPLDNCHGKPGLRAISHFASRQTDSHTTRMRTVILRTGELWFQKRGLSKGFTFNSTFCNNAICVFFRLTAFCDDFKPCLSIHSPCFALLRTLVSKACLCVLKYHTLQ